MNKVVSISCHLLALFVLAACSSDQQFSLSEFNRPKILFDGGSVVFDIGKIEGDHYKLMLLNDRYVDSDGAYQYRKTRNFMLFNNKQKALTGGEFVNPASPAEAIVMRRLNEIETRLSLRNEPRLEQCKMLIRLLNKRDTPSPEIGFWHGE